MQRHPNTPTQMTDFRHTGVVQFAVQRFEVFYSWIGGDHTRWLQTRHT